MKQDLISVMDVKEDIEKILEISQALKKKREIPPHLKGKQLGMIFEKPSTRTRVSFEVAINKLGGDALYLSPKDLQLGRGETVEDTAMVLSRYVDFIMYRAFSHKNMLELARGASVPVINGLDDMEHPCQILADLLTIKEHKRKLNGITLAWIGDGNNVCHSLMLGCTLTGINMQVGCPIGYEPKQEYFELAKKEAARKGSDLKIVNDPIEAAKGADVVYTDVWISMGDEAEQKKRLKDFSGYQVDGDLLQHAKRDAIFMHCLPAHYGQEVTHEVAHGMQSVIFDEAENRMWAQMAVLLYLSGMEKL
jgi:ornithine carbamoyltransferase